MSRYGKFLRKQAKDVYWGNGEPDHPTCPDCGATMDFHGGDLAIGDGYWDCPGCDYSFTEDDLEDYEV